MASVQGSGGREVKIRNSNIELLRIIAMLMIVFFHCAVNIPWQWTDNCISGYFMYSTKKFKFKRIFKILRLVWFYSFLAFMIALLCGVAELKFPLPKTTANSLFPVLTNAYWFIGEYIIIQLLNLFIQKV